MHSNESRRLGGSPSLCVRSDELLKPNNQDQNLGQACIHTLPTILHNFPNPKNKKLARVTYLSAIHIVKGKAILIVIVKQKRVREVYENLNVIFLVYYPYLNLHRLWSRLSLKAGKPLQAWHCSLSQRCRVWPQTSLSGMSRCALPDFTKALNHDTLIARYSLP